VHKHNKIVEETTLLAFTTTIKERKKEKLNSRKTGRQHRRKKGYEEAGRNYVRK